MYNIMNKKYVITECQNKAILFVIFFNLFLAPLNRFVCLILRFKFLNLMYVRVLTKQLTTGVGKISRLIWARMRPTGLSNIPHSLLNVLPLNLLNSTSMSLATAWNPSQG